MRVRFHHSLEGDVKKDSTAKNAKKPFGEKERLDLEFKRATERLPVSGVGCQHYRPSRIHQRRSGYDDDLHRPR